MQEEIKVTFVIPAYNVEKCIGQCINSIRRIQNFNVEIVVVNDGSTDNTAKICECIQDSRIRLINQENSGVSAARNKGIKLSQGQYIAFVDADDQICASEYEEVIQSLKSKDEIVMFSYIYRNKQKDVYMDCPLPKGVYGREGAEQLAERMLDVPVYKNKKSNVLGARVWQYMFQRDFLKKNELTFVEELPYAEDLCFCLSCLKVCGSLRVSDKCAYVYELNLESAGRKYREEFWKELKRVAVQIDKIQGNQNDLLYLAYGKSAIRHYCLNLPIHHYGEMKKQVSEIIQDGRFISTVKDNDFQGKTALEKVEEHMILKKRIHFVVMLNIIKTCIMRCYYSYGRRKVFGKAKIS